MDIERMIEESGEALYRCIRSAAPWVIGFGFTYFMSHVIIAFLKGWL